MPHAGEDSVQISSSDFFTIDPLEVILIGKTIELLRALPEGLGAGELWECIRRALPECG